MTHDPLRLLGAMAVRREQAEIEGAQAHDPQGLALANERRMRPLMAHCHLGLGTLDHKTGRVEQAHAALCAAIDRYRTMDITFWLP